MPDDSRFNDISEALEGDQPDESEAEATDERKETAATETGAEPEGEEIADPLETPAFAFDESKQRPLYAREESWQEFEDTLDLDVGLILRREHGLRDVPRRELHDAVLRVAAEHPEEIAAALLDSRGLDGDVPDDAEESV